MAEDFHIKFYSASNYEDQVHSRLVEPHERVDLLLPLLYQLIESENKSDELQVCPVCGHTMEVSFSKRFQTSISVNIGVECKTCKIIVLFESDKVPAWVQVWNIWK